MSTQTVSRKVFAGNRFPELSPASSRFFPSFLLMLNHYEFLSLVKEGKFGCEESQVHTLLRVP